MIQRIFLTVLVWACCIPALICTEAHAGQTLNFQGKTSAQIQRFVSVPHAMLVQEVRVAVGTVVSRGTPLLQYGLLPQEARYYQNLLFSKENSLLVTQQQISGLAQERQEANFSLNRSQKLAAQGLAPKAEQQRTSAALKTINARKKQLQSQLKSSKREYDLLLAEFDNYFGTRLKPGDQLPDVLNLPAPIGGTVIKMAPTARVGGLIPAGAMAVTIAALDPIQAEVQVHESEAEKLHVGDAVTVEVPTLGGATFPGRIVSLSWLADDMSIAMPSFYIMTIDIENKDNAIRPGYKILAHVTVN